MIRAQKAFFSPQAGPGKQRKVAFTAATRSGDTYCAHHPMVFEILDFATGKLTRIPYSVGND
jgi:hypothetical protein